MTIGFRPKTGEVFRIPQGPDRYYYLRQYLAISLFKTS
jgi:hypothetical protein